MFFRGLLERRWDRDKKGVKDRAAAEAVPGAEGAETTAQATRQLLPVGGKPRGVPGFRGGVCAWSWCTSGGWCKSCKAILVSERRVSRSSYSVRTKTFRAGSFENGSAGPSFFSHFLSSRARFPSSASSLGRVVLALDRCCDSVCFGERCLHRLFLPACSLGAVSRPCLLLVCRVSARFDFYIASVVSRALGCRFVAFESCACPNRVPDVGFIYPMKSRFCAASAFRAWTPGEATRCCGRRRGRRR